MRKLRTLSMLMLLLIGAVGLVSCDDDDDDGPEPTENIIEFLADESDFDQFVDALDEANLQDLLGEPGPYTVFAPDNDAWDAYLLENGYDNIDEIDEDFLTTVLENHIIGGELQSGNLQTGYGSTMADANFDGAPITLFVNTDNGVMLNGMATVNNADNLVNNGVVHRVDQVIELPTPVTFVTADESFSMLTEALTMTGLTTDFVDVLNGDGPFTVFAPTNAAFQNLLASNDDWSSLNDIPVATLETVLMYHVTTEDNYRAAELQSGQTISTLANQSITINITGNTATIEAGSNSADIVFTDIQGVNGVVHAIDTVLLPE